MKGKSEEPHSITKMKIHHHPLWPAILPLMIHVEKFTDELVDGVLGFDFDIHGEKEGEKEQHSAR